MRPSTETTPPPTTTRSRMRGEERREQLINAAVHLFATTGLRGTTTKAIAQAAGVSEAIIFRHFPTKEDLYHAILEHKTRGDSAARVGETLQRQMAAGNDAAVVGALVAKTLEAFRSDPDFHRLMLRASLEQHDLADMSRRTRGVPFFELLRDYVARRQDAGAFCTGDPALLAFALVALPVYFATVRRIFGVELVEQADDDVADTLSRLILDGLRSRSDAGASDANQPHRPRSRAKDRSNNKRRPTRG